jgi:hypothetical protein
MYKDKIYDVLSGEPVTPNEVVKMLSINFKTAKDVHYKASGRIHIFWREEV